jgi:PIN domain nuclease of toxin-antitoxin system
MRLLLDTHTILWFFGGHANITDQVKDLIENQDNLKLISLASVWEMAIKQSKNKLDLGKTASDYIQEKVQFADFKILPIELQHLTLISTLEFYHKDPFDRLLIAQGISEDIAILSKDIALDSYSIKRIWD